MEIKVVQVESMLEEIMPIFLGSIKQDFSKISASLSSSNFDEINAISHKIKGNAGGYGFDELGEMAKALESASKEGDIGKAMECFKSMVYYMGHIKIEYVD